MKNNKRKIAKEIIDGLTELAETLEAGTPLHQKYTVRTVRAIPTPRPYTAAAVRKTRQLLAVSQPVFAHMLGVSAALVRSWEIGQRRPSPMARRMLDMIRANPQQWRAMVEAA